MKSMFDTTLPCSFLAKPNFVEWFRKVLATLQLFRHQGEKIENPPSHSSLVQSSAGAKTRRFRPPLRGQSIYVPPKNGEWNEQSKFTPKFEQIIAGFSKNVTKFSHIIIEEKTCNLPYMMNVCEFLLSCASKRFWRCHCHIVRNTPLYVQSKYVTSLFTWSHGQ